MAIFKSLSASRKRLLLAVTCGVLAALLISVYVSGLQAQAASSRNAVLAEYGGDMVDVLVAARDIAAGETLSAENATMQPWLAELLPGGAFTQPEQAYGQSLSVPVYPNEPLLQAKISSSEHQLEVPDGLCALSIPVTDEMAVGGAIAAGSAVDVYAVGDVAVSLVAAGVMVLESSNAAGEAATGLFDSSARAALKWVTLAVRSEMVSELLAAARDKNLSLVLPGQNASAVLAVPPAGLAGSAENWTDAAETSAEAQRQEANGSANEATSEDDLGDGTDIATSADIANNMGTSSTSPTSNSYYGDAAAASVASGSSSEVSR